MKLKAASVYLKAKIRGHLLMPFDDLGKGAVVAVGPSVRVQETAHGVSTKIGTVRVELPSIVIRLHVDEALVKEANDLDVVWCAHELDTLQSSGRYDTGAMPWLRAPCDFLALGIGDS